VNIILANHGWGDTKIMTDKIRRRHIQIETHEVTIIRNGSGRTFELCPKCQAMVNALSPNEAAREIQMSGEEIITLVNNGEIHLVEQTGDHEVLICGNSLENQNS